VGSVIPRLSVIVPVFNEERTIDAVLHRLSRLPYPHPDQQVIVVDDGSTDGTPRILAGWVGRPGVEIVRHTHNQGKGAAVRTGLGRAAGAITVIQDADLEYDPTDLAGVVEAVARGGCDAAYGSRYLAPDPSLRWTRFRVAVGLMNLLVRVLYGGRLTDVNTCYKALPTDLYRRLDLRSDRFELCAETTAKLLRGGYRILELPISYRPRTRAEGKKIGWRDAVRFARALVVWRVRAKSSRPAPRRPPTEAIAAPPNDAIDPTLGPALTVR
jgi:glycosyltransferase involved in cell wall biosynthesis